MIGRMVNMLISKIIPQMELKFEYYLVNELDFTYLGLAGFDIPKCCVFIELAKYIDTIDINTSMVITNEETMPLLEGKGFGLCVVSQPRIFFFQLHNFLTEMQGYKRDCFATEIGQGCKISTLSVIAPNNVQIGNHVIIEEFVVIRENTVIGDNTVIRTGTKIGGIGYEFKQFNNAVFGVKHCGGVKIGKNVELQQNTCVDRAIYPWDNTEIDDFTTADNLVHIGHAAKLGKRVMLPAGVVISGRTIIGDDAWIGVGSTLSNGIEIGAHARVSLGSVVTKSVPANTTVTGNFAIAHEKFIENLKKQR